MRNLLRVIILSLVMAFATLSTSALSTGSTDLQSQPEPIQQEGSDSATVRVIPNESTLGNNHTILITGLDANQEISVRIIEVATEAFVYDTDQTANSRGVVEIDIFSERSDAPGEYRVEAVGSNGDVLGSTILTLLEPETFAGNVTVEPLSGEAGTVFTISISDVRPFAVIEVFVENDIGDEIFSQRLRSSVDGLAEVSFESDELAIGTLTVTVIENETNEIAETQIEVQERALPATIAVDPQPILPGDTVFITVSGLEPETDIVLDVQFEGTTVGTLEATANVNGLVIVPYDIAGDAELGTYIFSAMVGEELVARTRVPVEIPSVSASVTPQVGTTNTSFFLTVNELRPDEEVTVEFTFDDEILETRTARADENGDARIALGQRMELELGTYGIRVLRLGQLVYSTTVQVAEERPPTPITIDPEDVSLSVSPESGPIPTEYTLTVEGVPPETDLTLFILFDGQSVLSLSGTADENGVYSTVVTSEPSDPPGTYVFEVRAEGQVIGSVEFEIADEAAETDEGEDTEEQDEIPPVGEGDAILDISPEILRQGERIEFFARELTPGEVVTFELFFDNAIIYSAERAANPDGIASVALVAREDEAPGHYEMRVLRGDEVIASNMFIIVSSETEIDAVEISIVPPSAEQGDDFTVTVSGLDAEETVDVIISFDGEVVFETERTANDQGTFTIALTSDADDEAGTYTVTVVRDSGDVNATFEITPATDDITGDDEQDEVDSEATISVTPDSGVLETDHDVQVIGLAPGETFTFEIEYDGEVVYSVEREADEDGVFETTISTTLDDPTGEYEIIIDRADADDISTTLLIEAEVADAETSASEFEIIIEPDEVDPEEAFNVRVTGLEAGETITLDVLFDDEVVFTTEREANEQGEVVVVLATDPGDPTGVYTINVTRGDDVQSATVRVRGEEVASTAVQVSVDPNSAPIGSAYEFTISGLASGETFDIVVEFDGETVFEATRTADVSGLFVIELETSTDDEAGTYTFNVVRDGEVIADVDFEVEAVTIETDDADDAEEDITEAEEPAMQGVITYADGVTVTFDAETPEQIVQFDGQAGDVIAIRVDSGGELDTVATLTSPTGETLASDDDGGLGFDPEIERVVLPETGAYTLALQTFNEGDSGSAQVTITVSDMQTLNNNETRTVRLNSKITTDLLTFEGEAGEIISLIVELENGAIGDLAIIATQGDNQLMRYETFGLPDTITLGFAVPEDGTVVIRFEDDGTGNAVLNARILRE